MWAMEVVKMVVPRIPETNHLHGHGRKLRLAQVQGTGRVQRRSIVRKTCPKEVAYGKATVRRDAAT
jgi:hypothetical protein